MSHRLEPLLRPRRVAVVGASAREDSMGEWVLENLRRGGFAGDVYPVNPGYDDINGVRCFASLKALPERPDLVIFAVADANLEPALDDAIAAGIPAAVIMTSLILDDDTDPPLKERVRRKTTKAGMLVCGANGMGFYNVRDSVWACGFDSTYHAPPGNVAIISHSGSGMSGIIDCEERLRINFAVSTGNEIGVTMDEYLDFVLDLPETRAVGLFVETARNPRGFRKALEKARERRIPIVALKVGRTEKSRQLTVSHSGAMAGDDAAYDALFDRYGVQRVFDQDAWTSALILFAELPPLGQGGLVSLHDSGGERQLMLDMAEEIGVPLTELQPATVAALEKVLDPELPAVNPLDAWSRGGPSAGRQMTECLTLMMQDDGAAMGAVVHDRAPGGGIYASYLSYMQHAHAQSGKPVALVSARAGTGSDDAVVKSTHAGFPVLDGLRSFLVGVRALFAYRDFLLQPPAEIPRLDERIVAHWDDRLDDGETLGEAEALEMLQAFGIETSRPVFVQSADDAVRAAGQCGYPVVLKTAREGVLHKTEQQGVVLAIEDAASLRKNYDELTARLGPDAIVAPMVRGGVELFLGVKRDSQFGPIVLIGFGGTHAEILQDVTFALPPFDAAHARRCLDRLQLRPLLDGARGARVPDIDAFCDTAARFSAMVARLSDVIAEVDVNPIIALPDRAVAVDALVVGKDRRRRVTA
ncbi:MAG: acetate--CoA ligase family protein [Woeseiaceae bacterium]|nr:acetate--CoA ligase family protein [Woeseiaceae bacterium]